ncbi:hypothetical protein [Bacillus infantis]|uniref:hypothetical protein n=1 Tax=Bacillus infantis TaxID=324767 RepID=UPI003CED7446
MPFFRSVKEIEKYIATKHGQDAVMNETKIKRILTSAAKQLERYMKEELDNYFNSYEPSVYERTSSTISSIKVGNPRKVTTNIWAIEITFDEELANHDSVMGSDQPKGYTPWLLEVGWDIRDKVDFEAPMFTHHPGTEFVKKAVKKFNANNPHKLKISVSHNGQKYI